MAMAASRPPARRLTEVHAGLDAAVPFQGATSPRPHLHTRAEPPANRRSGSARVLTQNAAFAAAGDAPAGALPPPPPPPGTVARAPLPMIACVGRLRIQIATDGLTAEVHVSRGAAMVRSELEGLLAAAEVVFGLDAEKITELAARLVEETWVGRAVVARGVAPQPGQDGRLELTCQPGPIAGVVTPTGNIDFHERALLCSAVAGEVVATIVPPVIGSPGTDVRGRAIAGPPPKTVAPRLGPGCEAGPDGQILAVVDGVVRRVGDKEIDVLQLWKHDSNVDLHSGNLHIKGTLVVRGDVCEGFTVAATGDVVVQGAVLDGHVEAHGNVVVGQSIQGHCEVHASNDLSCRHATAAHLEADGVVRIQDQAVHCIIRGHDIEMLRGRGHVVGGELRAAHSIKVLEAGTEAGAETVLVAADMTEQHKELARREAAGHKVARQSQKVLVGSGRSDRGKGGKLGRDQVNSENLAMTQRLEVARRQRELLQHASITVKSRLHPGVRIQLGLARLEIQEPLLGATFRWNDEQNAIVQDQP